MFAVCCLGFFSGPLLTLTSSWSNQVPGGFLALASVTVGLGVALFTRLEGVSESEAAYASVVTGMENIILRYDEHLSQFSGKLVSINASPFICQDLTLFHSFL